MPNSNYRRGRELEYEVKREYESHGYSVIRASGSHGIYDLVVFNSTPTFYFIQCKVVKDSKQIKKLINEFRKTSIIPFTASRDGVLIEAYLAVKVTGKKGYTLYN